MIAYVNRHPHAGAYLTQRELAEEAGVSKPTIIRCFRRLGFSSFREFQASVERFFATQIDSLSASRYVHDRIADLYQLVREAAEVDRRSLERLAEAVTGDQLKTIAARMQRARTVYVVGPSTGRYPAHYLAQRLPRYGITAVLAPQDSRHVPDLLHGLGPDDVLVVFHYSDDDRPLRRLLGHAAKLQSWTVLASAFIHPDYVEASDLFVHVPRGEMEFKNSMAVPMHFANLLLLAYEHLFRVEVDEHLTALEQTRRLWNGPSVEQA
ncbi:MAG: MurR/RpiR family transcriptional regulator [Spirochaetales bacterium]|nr:MurR/RpiR family transcriptional regulator [Spirochaetales bacterium]